MDAVTLGLAQADAKKKYPLFITVTPAGTPASDVTKIQAALTAATAAGGAHIRLQPSAFGAAVQFQINQTILLPAAVAVTLEMAPGTIMTATTAMDSMITKPAGGPATGLAIGKLNLDCNLLAARGIELEQATLAHLYDLQIKNFTDTGVEFGRQGGLVLEIVWDGYSRLTGIDENRPGATAAQMPAYGMKAGVQVTDSTFNNVTIKNCVKGVRDTRGANDYTNVHPFGYPVLGAGTNSAAQDYTTQVGFELIGGLIRLTNCHPDTAIVGYYSEGVQNTIVDSRHYWPATFSSSATILPYKVYGGDLTVIGGNPRLPSTSSLTGYMAEVSGASSNLTLIGVRFYGTGWNAACWNLLNSAAAPRAIGCAWSSGNIPNNLDLQGGVLSAASGSGVVGAVASNRDLVWKTATNTRWTMRTDSAAESGGNSGSAFRLNAHQDNGNFLFAVASIQRYNGVFVHERAVQAPISSQTVSTDGAVTIDAALSNDHIVYLDANATSSTIGMTSSTGSATIQNGHKLAISVIQGAAGGKTFTWPTNTRFASNASPGNPNIGRMSTVHFRYRNSLWLEVARVIDVPTG